MNAETFVSIKNYKLCNFLFCLIFLFVLTSSIFSQAIPLDVSGMFNERGFLKSGSVSPDEGEMVNNFNGNLCYTFPMYSLKGPGDIHMDLSLNYNGSVNYQIVAATKGFLTGNTLPRHNVSAPGWILSLNGMAIQMMNFETNFFSTPNSGDSIANSKVRLLAMGYHLTDNLQSLESGMHDVITLMRGDGSAVYLKRISNYCTNDENFAGCYVGDYYVDGLGDYSRAKVEFIEYASQPSYRNRRVSFMKGDGLTYIYEEYKNQYADFTYNTTSSYMFKPQVFLLKAVKDRFGNKLELSYDYSIYFSGGWQPVYGRPVIKSIVGSWPGSSVSLNYVVNGNLAVTLNSNGNYYKILCAGQQANFDSLNNHRYYPTSLVNPVNAYTNFEHLSYTRSAHNMYNPLPNHQDMKMSLINDDGVKRLKSVENYFNGKREYTYIDSSLSEWSIDMKPGGEYKICSGNIGQRYFGQGRDVFFVNMVGSKVSYDDSAVVSNTSYNYYFDVNGRSDTLTEPINYNDYYSTRIITSNPSGNTLYDTPDNKGTFFKYRNYKITPGWDIHQEYPDWQGHTKLYETIDFIGDTNSIVKKTQYYDGNYIDSGVSKGAFLDTAIVEKINNSSKTTSFRYGYFNTPFTEDTYKNPLQSILQIDNFGLKTVVYNTFMYDSSAHYVNAKYKANSSLSEQEGDTTYFYIINQPTGKRIFTTSQSSPLYFDSLQYLRTNSDSGYMGQVILKRNYDVSNLSNYKDVKFAYYVRDTVGRFLYPVADTKPSNEGKLKTITDARSNPVKYYYHPVYETEYQTDELPRPQIKFYILNANGTTDSISQMWEDIRMPVITQSFVSESNSLFLFNKYDPSGKVTYAFNDNKYLNQLTYDSLERIKQVNFPYDFGIPDTSIYVDTVFEDVEIDLKADLVSVYDFMAQTTLFYTNYNSACSIIASYDNIYNLFSLTVQNPGGPPPESSVPVISSLPMIRFPASDLIKSIRSISSAQFKIYPKNFSRYTDGDTSLSKVRLFINPLKKLDFNSNSIIFTESNTGYYYSADAFMSPASNCTDYFENIFDVTQMLNTHIFTNSDSVLAFKINALPVYNTQFPPEQDYSMYFYYPCNNFSSWCSHATPVLHITGVKETIKRDTILTYANFSSKFTYDKSEKSVQTELKYNNQSTGKRKSLFDGFYRVRQNRLYTSENDFDSTAVKYNYLSLKLNSKDGRENLTKYSYNQYLNPSKTENPDASYTLVTETYYNGYNYTFGAISGMVVKKVFTDEAGNNFEKYYDAVGNLRREIKYVEGIPSDNPEVELIPHVTDYKYDDLYRVIEVKTPNNKHIYYSYDGLGRQSSRTTPDAGLVKYKYDKNDNLRFSQDNNQANKPTETPPSKQLSYRGYDGLNRLLYLCDSYNETYLVPWSNLNPDDTYYFDSYSYTPKNFLVINVYDTITNYPANANIFLDHKPLDYDSAASKTNNTKGSLCATAYRTLGTDSMSFKYYRYDARGRVIKMWNYIAGLGMKVTSYEYNSQNQITELIYQSGYSGTKTFKYDYDYAGRLLNTSISYIPQDSPEDFMVFNSFTYNQNSQINTFKFDPINLIHNNTYDNRNRITNYSCSKPDIFSYSLSYYSNSNIQSQSFSGQYKDSFTNQDNLSTSYTYDKSNRLLNANFTHTSDNTFDLTNTYDPDGNILTMQRYGSNNNLTDNFTYDYYSGTNRLKKVSGSTDQYTYDYNGNQTNDYINNNTVIKYDHRNLITEFTRQDLNQDPPITDVTRYKYDEAGNRIRKTTYRSNDANPTPLPEEEADLPQGWSINLDEYYSRDASGKEIGIYSSYTLQYWNVWSGNEITGRINNNENADRNYYLKDHLGSIRVVLDNSKNIVSANDYDMWGNYLQNRTYSTTNTKNKFTGKERDLESSYDYFGARYYDARVGRWGQIEPLLDKYISYSPYQYGLLNPIRLFDANGCDVYIFGSDATNTVKAINESTNNNFFVSIDPSTGKLSYEGEAQTDQEFFIKIAIDDEKSKVLLQTVDGNYFSDDNTPMVVGGYLGSERINGITNTSQLFNIAHAETWEKAGGSNVGLSAIHEILESYFGGLLNPNQGIKYDKKKQELAHKVTTNFESPKQYYPTPRNYFINVQGGKLPWKTTLYNEKTKKEYLLYENK